MSNEASRNKIHNKLKADEHVFNFSTNIMQIFKFRCAVIHIHSNKTKLKLTCKGNTYVSWKDRVFEDFSFWKDHNKKMNQTSMLSDIL